MPPLSGIARQLGAAEKLLWLADRNRPTHFAIVGDVGGVTHVEQWQFAKGRKIFRPTCSR